jgi:hypothetical protein
MAVNALFDIIIYHILTTFLIPQTDYPTMVHDEINKIGKQSDELMPPLTRDEFIKIKTALDPHDFAVIDQLGMKILAIRSPTDFPDMVTDLEVVAPELSLEDPETLTHAVIIGNQDNLGVPVDMVVALIQAKKQDDARIVASIRDKIKHPLETYLFKDQYDQKPVLRLGIRSPMPLEELQDKEFKEVFEGVPVPNGTRVVYIIAADGYMKISAKEFLREMGEAIAPPPILFHRALPQPEEKTPQMQTVDVDLGDIIDHQFTVSEDDGEKVFTIAEPKEKPAPAPEAAPEPIKALEIPVAKPAEAPKPPTAPPELESPPELKEEPAGPPPDLKAVAAEFETVPEQPQAPEPVVELEAPPEVEEFEEIPEEAEEPKEVVPEEMPAEAEAPKGPIQEAAPEPVAPPAPELTPVAVPPPPEEPHPHIVMKPIPDPILPSGTPVGPYETLETAPVRTYETLETTSVTPYETLEGKMADEQPYVVKPDEPQVKIERPCPPPPPVPVPVAEEQLEELSVEAPEGPPALEQAPEEAPAEEEFVEVAPQEAEQVQAPPEEETAEEEVLEEAPVMEEAVDGPPQPEQAPEEVIEEPPAAEPEPRPPPIIAPVPEPVPVAEPTPIPTPTPVIRSAPLPPPLPAAASGPLPPFAPKPLITRRDEGGSLVEKLTERMAPEEPLSAKMGTLSEGESRWFTAKAPKAAAPPPPTKAQEIMTEGVKRARLTDIRTALMSGNFSIRAEGALGGFDIQATKRYRRDITVLVSYITSPRLRDYLDFERRLRAFPDGVGILISEGAPDKELKINAIGKPIVMIGIDELRDIELYIRDIVL